MVSLGVIPTLRERLARIDVEVRERRPALTAARIADAAAKRARQAARQAKGMRHA